MTTIKIPLVKDGQQIVYPEDKSLFKNTQIVGSEIICDYYGESTEYDKYVAPFVDITLTATPRYKVGDTVTFNFTTNLPDDTYYMPFHLGDSQKKLKENVVSNGTGSLTFTFSESGIYYINGDELEGVDLKVNGVLTSNANRFTVYVAE